MSLYKSAQLQMENIEIEMPSSEDNDEAGNVVVYEEAPAEKKELEVCEPQVVSEEPFEIVFKLPSLPGAPEDVIEVEEGPDKEEKKSKDKDSDKSKEEVIELKDHFDIPDLSKFLFWLKDVLDRVPQHSGKDVPGLERAISYLKRVLSEISKAMQRDYRGEIDSNKVSDAMDQIYDGIDRLEDRLTQVRDKKYNRKKKADLSNNEEIVKEAQKAPFVSGTVIVVPLLISSIARAIVNGTISGGQDLEELYKEMVKKHKLDLNQQTELIQLLFDMNMPIRRDFIYGPDEDTTNREGGSLNRNYPG